MPGSPDSSLKQGGEGEKRSTFTGGVRTSFLMQRYNNAASRRRSSLADMSTQFLNKITASVQTKDSEQDNHSKFEALRLRVKTFMTVSTFGIVYEWVVLFLSVLSCLLYIVQTYLSREISETDITNPVERRANLAEYALAGVFTFDVLLSFFMAERKAEYFTNFVSMIDLISVIPTWVTFERNRPNYTTDLDSPVNTLLWIFFGLRAVRVLRPLRINNFLSLVEDEVQQKLGSMLLTILVMIVFNAGVMQFLEAEIQPLPYHTWLYVIWITTATVGYGDISPSSTIGRIAVMVMIGYAVIMVPMMTNELLEKMSQTSVYARVSYLPKPHSKHVLICGDLSSTSITEFFSELFHEDHENINLYAVILQPDPPSYQIRLLLRNPLFTLAVAFLEGTPLNERDLMRARADSAVAVFIMTNKFSGSPDEEDSKTILQQFSIKRFNQMLNPDMLFCLQLVRPENRRHLVDSTEEDTQVVQEDTDLIVCLNEIKMGVIAETVMFPGTSTLIMNLLTSFSEDNPPDEIKGGDSDSDEEPFKETEDEPIHWSDEYQNGCDWEIYTTELSDMFEGASFSRLAQSMYSRLGVVLFALVIQDVNYPRNRRTMLNPSSYVIPKKTEFHIYGLVIGQNKASSDLSYSSLAATLKAEGADIKMFTQQLSGLQARRKFTDRGKREGGGGSLAPLSSIGEGEATNVKEKNSDGPAKKRLRGNALLKVMKEAKISVDSEQEKLHKMEEEYMTQNYYVRTGDPVSMADITISTSMANEIPHSNNHIIITGKGMRNLYDLIRPLRAKDLGPMKFIVILYPDDIPHAVWLLISMFEGILLVKGSPLEESDIRRAGIFRAAQVVILADSSTDSHGAKHTANAARGVEALVDADAIFAYKAMKRLNEKAQVVVEIVRHANIGYLELNELTHGDGQDYKFTPQFASGALFTSSLLDTIVCQAFYNPQIITVVNRLISGKDQKELINSVHQTYRASFVGAAVVRAKQLESIAASSLYQVPVPSEFVKLTYGELFKHYSLQGIIPLGLYRGVVPHLNKGQRQNSMSYVYTNPDANAELFQCDKVFVLSSKPLYAPSLKPLQEISNKIQIEKEIHQLQTTKQQRGSVRKTPTPSMRWTGLLKKLDLMVTTVKGLLPIHRIGTVKNISDVCKKRITEFDAAAKAPSNFHVPDDDNKDDANNRISAQLESESKKIKYVFQCYIPQIRCIKEEIKNGVAVSIIHQLVLPLVERATTDEYKLLLCWLNNVKDVIQILLLIEAQLLEVTKKKVTDAVSNFHQVVKKESSSDSDSDSDSNSDSEESGSKRKPLTNEEYAHQQFSTRAKELLTDMVDALEISCWDSCSSYRAKV